MFKRICLFIAVLMIFNLINYPFAISTNAQSLNITQATALPSFDTFTEILSNDALSLSVLTTKREFNFCVLDKKSGNRYYSYPLDWENDNVASKVLQQNTASHLLAYYADNKTKNIGVVNSVVGSYRLGDTKWIKGKESITVFYTISVQNDKFVIPVKYSIENNAFSAEILFDKIEENSNLSLTEIVLLPNFSAASSIEEGYIFVPDGCGAIIDFKAKEAIASTYKQKIYGRDAVLSTLMQTGKKEEIKMPVYGMKKNNGSFLAIVEQGESMGEISANPIGVSNSFSNVFATFTYRQMDTAVIADKEWSAKEVSLLARNVSTVNPIVSYHFLNNQNSDYSAMALEYKKYLISKGIIKDKKMDLPKINLDVYGVVKRKMSILGFVITLPYSLTSFNEAKEMIDFFDSKGIKNINMRYFGWTKGGLMDAVLTSPETEGALGSENDFKKLLGKTNKNISIYPDADFERVYEQKFGWWSFNFATKNVSRGPSLQNTYLSSTYFRNSKEKPYNLLTPSLLPKTTNGFLSGYGKYNAKKISLSTLTSLLYSDFSSDLRYSDRNKSITYTKDVLEKISKNYGIAADNANAYSLGYTEHIFNAPMFDSSFDSAYSDVPFYQIVLNGCVSYSSSSINLSEDSEMLFLRLLETATQPAFTFTYKPSVDVVDTKYNFLLSTQFSNWKDTALSIFEKYNLVYKDFAGQTITDHTIINKDLRVTKFSNNAEIIVNYSNLTQNYKGKSIEAKSYLVLKGGE